MFPFQKMINSGIKVINVFRDEDNQMKELESFSTTGKIYDRIQELNKIFNDPNVFNRPNDYTPPPNYGKYGGEMSLGDRSQLESATGMSIYIANVDVRANDMEEFFDSMSVYTGASMSR